MIIDDATQVLHPTVYKVILRLESLLEILEDHLNLRRLLQSLVSHVPRVELPTHVILTLNLLDFCALRSDFRLGLSEFCFSGLELVLCRM